MSPRKRKTTSTVAISQTDKAKDLVQEKKPIQMKAPSVPVSKAEVEYYTVEKWHGIRTVYKCSKCGEFRDTESMIQNHVLKHYPKSKHGDIIMMFRRK